MEGKGKWKKRDVRAVNAAEPDGDDHYGLASLEYEDIFEDLVRRYSRTDGVAL